MADKGPTNYCPALPGEKLVNQKQLSGGCRHTSGHFMCKKIHKTIIKVPKSLIFDRVYIKIYIISTARRLSPLSLVCCPFGPFDLVTVVAAGATCLHYQTDKISFFIWDIKSEKFKILFLTPHSFMCEPEHTNMEDCVGKPLILIVLILTIDVTVGPKINDLGALTFISRFFIHI